MGIYPSKLGGYTSPGANNLAFVLGGGPPYANVLLDSINTLSPSQDIASLNTISLSNGPFNSMFVAAIGDTNGSGLTDMALFSEWVPSVYILYGTASPVNVDLSTLNGTNGYQITNPNVNFDNITTLVNTNINADGFTDVVYHYNDNITGA
ncbi:MAG: hypothetical protein M3R00_09190, partial [Pseudomonadota bacterium]|nr:hypothetical protein [Pseudomonadota bacterium]